MQSRKLGPMRWLRRWYRIYVHTSAAWNNLSFVPSLTSSLFSRRLSSPSSASFPSPLSPSFFSTPEPFILTKSTRVRSYVEYRRFREILRKNLHNFRNCLLMLEMKEPATEWSSESFRLFLYKFSSSSFSLDSSAFSDLKLPTPTSQTTAAGQASPHSRRYCSVFGNLANFENLPRKLIVTGGEDGKEVDGTFVKGQACATTKQEK